MIYARLDMLTSCPTITTAFLPSSSCNTPSKKPPSPSTIHTDFLGSYGLFLFYNSINHTYYIFLYILFYNSINYYIDDIIYLSALLTSSETKRYGVGSGSGSPETPNFTFPGIMKSLS